MVNDCRCHDSLLPLHETVNSFYCQSVGFGSLSSGHHRCSLALLDRRPRDAAEENGRVMINSRTRISKIFRARFGTVPGRRSMVTLRADETRSRRRGPGGSVRPPRGALVVTKLRFGSAGDPSPHSSPRVSPPCCSPSMQLRWVRGERALALLRDALDDPARRRVDRLLQQSVLQRYLGLAAAGRPHPGGPVPTAPQRSAG
jgi:hypothetical protein